MFVAYFVTPGNLQVGKGFRKTLKNSRVGQDFCHNLQNISMGYIKNLTALLD